MTWQYLFMEFSWKYKQCSLVSFWVSKEDKKQIYHVYFVVNSAHYQGYFTVNPILCFYVDILLLFIEKHRKNTLHFVIFSYEKSSSHIHTTTRIANIIRDCPALTRCRKIFSSYKCTTTAVSNNRFAWCETVYGISARIEKITSCKIVRG